jgi:hypothetical protein
MVTMRKKASSRVSSGTRLFGSLIVIWCLSTLCGILNFDSTISVVDQGQNPTQVTETIKKAKKGQNPASAGKYMSMVELAKLEQLESAVVLPKGYDVLDIGASKGEGSIAFLQKAVKETLGVSAMDQLSPKSIGIDLDPAKVQTCIEHGQTCIQGNVLNLVVAEDAGGVSVAGSTMWHVLEHMPTCEIAKEIWHKSAQISRLFSLFHGPSFDQAKILSTASFHRFYENWGGHRCHFDSEMLINAIETSPLASTTTYIVANLKPITSSNSNVLLPNGASKDSHHYDPSIHPSKPAKTTTFSNVYEQMRACAVYEPLDQLSLYSALALLDVLGQLKNLKGKVVKCHIAGGVDISVYSNEECLSALKTQVTETIKKAKKGEMIHK